MVWAVLVMSGLLEAVWATALSRSDGFTRLIPSVIFVTAMFTSLAGLAYAMRTLPVGTSYAVWVGIGAGTTVAVAMLDGTEPASLLRVALMITLVGSVVGLKFTS